MLCDNQKSRFIKDQETNRLLSRLGIKVPILSKIPVMSDILF